MFLGLARKALLISFLTFIFFLPSLKANEVQKILQKISSKDRQRIENIFSFFVQKDSLGFVLFGETKPVCFTGIPLTFKEYVMPYKQENPFQFQKNLRLGWEAWMRHRHLFKHSNILLCEEYQRIDNGMYVQLFFVNKKTLKPLLHKYSADFIEILGENFSPDNFLLQLEKKKKLRPLIRYDQKLLGLLLGFGQEASAAFKEMYNGKEIVPALENVGHRPKGCSITPISFRGYKHSCEVMELMDRYTQEIQEIEKIFKSEQFLIRTLEAFCS